MSEEEQEETEERLNLVLLEIAETQDRIWERMESLDDIGMLKPEAEEHARQVMRDVSYWVDQCTMATESPPILLRRMEIHLARLIKVDELIEKMGQG